MQLRFEKAKRPDLACLARLKLTDLLVAEAKRSVAFAALTKLVKKYPTEGRYVPQLLQQMEKVSTSIKGGPAQVAGLYADMIPAMIAYYGSDRVPYAVRTIKQARAFMQEHNLKQASTTMEGRIRTAKAKLKAG